ncbi:GNAT family N-acetyltransferase [Arthrobacter sp. DNA4]|nr:GNAT family N-acetyltransferase [Arthrobacter sp. DNA4]UTT71610.1 GNAT family N-acetyltransferase [Arthrobacter sp. DNA4]
MAVTHPANAASQRVSRRIGLAHRGQTGKYYNALCELFGSAIPSA